AIGFFSQRDHQILQGRARAFVAFHGHLLDINFQRGIVAKPQAACQQATRSAASFTTAIAEPAARLKGFPRRRADVLRSFQPLAALLVSPPGTISKRASRVSRLRRAASTLAA